MVNKIVFIIPFAIISLIFGLIGGLARIGFNFFNIYIPFNIAHGSLMTGAFLGTLISLERAVVIKKNWAYISSFVCASSIFFIVFKFYSLAYLTLTIGGIGQIMIFISFLKKVKEFYLYLMLFASICWTIGNLLLTLTQNYVLVVNWWIFYFLLMITGERLELSKFISIPKRAYLIVIFSSIIYLISLFYPFFSIVHRGIGIALIIFSIFLLKYDVSRKTFKKLIKEKNVLTLLKNKQFFISLTILFAFVFLLISACFALFYDKINNNYDSYLHSFFLGFVFSMIFAHGPIIFPVLFNIKKELFSPLLYLPLLFLHLGLFMRLTGNIENIIIFKKYGALLSAIGIIAYFIFFLRKNLKAINSL